ncbi:hypothetical protein IQ241_23000 [Romeria aff. gracilis LEGE 07310]|uniref:Uncharacterized protein n=1 Tax=Vasconcelosia minhoensis LEGE 07310 TaxID=915328 RepID=A0A8J7ABS4_9CYAN|nr:hypothetical protein [Romeria gracilis]MBE9080125.1 hypothetical protein [Romeria aff. gracilis LEGE 07310]
MNIDQQIQTLVNDAPDPVAKQAVQAVAPMIKAIAERLKQLEYYILQAQQQGWLTTTLSSRQQPETSKRVIYAFPTLQAAAEGQAAFADPNLMALPHPVAHILFQMLSMQPVDSVIFLEPNARGQGIEIRRSDLKMLFRNQLQQLKRPSVPPDIA